MGAAAKKIKGNNGAGVQAAVPKATVKHPRLNAVLRGMGRGADTEPTPGSTANPPHTSHRTPGSDGLQPRNQEVFLTWGNPAGTLPTACPFDRAHGEPKTRADKLPRGMSLARRYPKALLNGHGYSIDAVEDALHDRQRLLAKWGIAGYGGPRDADGIDDGSVRAHSASGTVALAQFFAGQRKGMVRVVAGYKGFSQYLSHLKGERGEDDGYE